MLDLDDVFPAERARVRAALAVQAARSSYRLQTITNPNDPLFERAYAMLDDFFGDKGELEDKDTLRTLLQSKDLWFGEGLCTRYRLVVAYHQDELVALRDCYTEVDPKRRISLIAL